MNNILFSFPPGDNIDIYFHKLRDRVDELDNAQNPAIELELEKDIWTDDLEQNVRYQLNGLYEMEAERSLAEINRVSASAYICQIREAIVRTKIKNKRKMHVRYYGEECRIDDRRIRMPYAESGGLTEIMAIRLIEKIYARVERTGKKEVEIAYIGALTDTDALVEYCAKDGVEVRLHEYALRVGSECIYVEKDTGEQLNLKNLLMLSQFVTSNDIVLFLDDASLYRQFQSDKTFRERSRKLYIDRYYELGRKTSDLLKKIGYYSQMYEEVLCYLADRGKILSSKYEFDALLLRNLEKIVQSASDVCADVYCYIGTGGRVENRNIGRMNVCKDEYYEGKSLLVYKISNSGAVLKEKKVDPKVLCVELWKLVKSLGNGFYQKINDDIDFWRRWKIEIDFSNVQSEDSDGFFEVPYSFYGEDANAQESYKIGQLLNSVFYMAFENDLELSCVIGYLRTVIASLILCNANCVEGIVMSYLIRHGKKIKFLYNSNMTRKAGNDVPMKYTQRKAVNTIIEGLNAFIIRDVNRKSQILRYNFKERYAPDVEEEQFFNYLAEINSVSKRYGLTSTRMYLYTNEEEKVN